MGTFVLVHGAWGGGWAWTPLADRMRARGLVAAGLQCLRAAGDHPEAAERPAHRRAVLDAAQQLVVLPAQHRPHLDSRWAGSSGGRALGRAAVAVLFERAGQLIVGSFPHRLQRRVGLDNTQRRRGRKVGEDLQRCGEGRIRGGPQLQDEHGLGLLQLGEITGEHPQLAGQDAVGLGRPVGLTVGAQQPCQATGVNDIGLGLGVDGVDREPASSRPPTKGPSGRSAAITT